MIHLANARALLWLLLAMPIIAMYILKTRRTRKLVGSTLLWMSVKKDLIARHPFRRLVPETSLLLQLATLLCVAFALARPSCGEGSARDGSIAIVVDTSASMQAKHGNTSRFATMKDDVTNYLNHVSPGSKVMIVEALAQPRVVFPLDADMHRARSALLAIAPTDAEDNLGGAIAVAADRLRADGGGHIVVFTDECPSKRDPIVVSGVTVEVRRTAVAEENVGIVQTSAAYVGSGREKLEVFSLIHNFGTRAQEVSATLVRPEAPTLPLTSRRILIAPGADEPTTLSFQPESFDSGKGLIVVLSPDDSLREDNRSFVRIPSSPELPVVLATGNDQSWLRRALLADTHVRLQTVTFDQLGRINVPADALLVTEGGCPKEALGKDWLAVAPPKGVCGPFEIGEPVTAPTITSWDRSDSRLRYISFDNVHIGEARKVSGATKKSEIVRSDRGAIIVDGSSPARSMTLVAFSPEDSDWPLKASFVLFVRNIIEGARAHRTEGQHAVARAGEPLSVSVPADVKEVTVTGPDETKRTLEAHVGGVVVPSPNRAGFYEFRYETPHSASWIVPVNLWSKEESDLAPRHVEIRSEGQATSSPARREPFEWARFLAWAIVLFLMLDFLQFTKKPKRAFG